MENVRFRYHFLWVLFSIYSSDVEDRVFGLLNLIGPSTEVKVHFQMYIFSVLLRENSSPPPDDFMNDDMDSYLIAMDTSIAPGPSAAGPPPPPVVASVCSEQPAVANHRTRLYSEDEDEEETGTPEGPPNKKVKSF